MFDLSLLRDARLTFVVVADTHHLVAPENQPLEFESRRSQAARAERALRLISTIEADFVVHLGDLAQAVPDAPGYDRALTLALDQLARCGIRPRHVAGNQDIGDKPDPTMPQSWVTSESLQAYHARFGQSWSSWDAAGVHFVTLNSQIMNTSLAEADAQQRWLESDLADNAGRRVIVFIHMAPFLVREDEPDLGHYDNIANPARGWLLDLARRYQIEMIFCGHSHFTFFNRVDATRILVVPSTSHTRPGFSEIFSSCPPDEQGRNDTAKLGFAIVRVHDDGARVHVIRTRGDTSPVETAANQARHVVTRLSADLPRSPLGVVARHPLSHAGEVPIAWPSAIRQPVRNDYPLLACSELGARYLRVPGSDLEDALQRSRLEVLRQEGVRVIATWLWSDNLNTRDHVTPYAEQVDAVELQITGTPWPTTRCFTWLRHRTNGVPLTLSCLVPGERVEGKQLPRARHGYHSTELAELNAELARHGVSVDRVLVQVPPDESPWETLKRAPAASEFGQIGAVDWLVPLAGTDDGVQMARAAEAMFAAPLLPGSRVYIDALVDLDRTMDIAHGLLDRQSNPRPAFHAVRCLNSILFSSPATWRLLDDGRLPGARVLGLAGSSETCWLLVPDEQRIERSIVDLASLIPGAAPAGPIRWFDLAAGTTGRVDADSYKTRPFPIETVTLVLVAGDTAGGR